MKKTTPLYLLASVALILTFSGCNISPEKSPSFIKLTQRLAEAEDAQKKSSERVVGVMRDFIELDEKIEAIRSDIKNHPVSSGGDAEALALAMERIALLDGKIDDLKTKLLNQEKFITSALSKQEDKIASRLASLPKSGSARASVPAKKTVTVASAPKPAKTTFSVKAPVTKPTTKVTVPVTVKENSSTSISGARTSFHVSSLAPPKLVAKSAAPVVSKSGAAGFYYQVRPGDTLLGLSRRYKSSSAKICKANSLAMSATLVAGQNIYIPGS